MTDYPSTQMSADGSSWDWRYYFDTQDVPNHPIHTLEHCRIGDNVTIAKLRRGKYVFLVGKDVVDAHRANWERRRYDQRMRG